MIKSLKHLDDGKVLLNDSVIIWFKDKFHVQYDKNIIQEMDAYKVALEYIDSLEVLLQQAQNT